MTNFYATRNSYLNQKENVGSHLITTTTTTAKKTQSISTPSAQSTHPFFSPQFTSTPTITTPTTTESKIASSDTNESSLSLTPVAQPINNTFFESNVGFDLNSNKKRTKWTKELHEQFLQAYNKYGRGWFQFYYSLMRN